MAVNNCSPGLLPVPQAGYTAAMEETDSLRKPEWLRINLESSRHYREVAGSLAEGGLHTVCEEARCPNLSECWSRHRTATFMILGDTCTRRCRFCNVKTGLPRLPDAGEPGRVAQAAARMQLRHVVVTMVNRDDLPDGGSTLMAATIRSIKAALPRASTEVLASDMMGRIADLDRLLDAAPTIISHNLETVRRLTPQVRSRSDYRRSLDVLAHWAAKPGGSVVKSSLMLGLGETREEVIQALADLREVGVAMVNLGQYLQPSGHHLAVQRWWTPEEFASLKEDALGLGFEHVEAGPLVRSSYHADGQYEAWRRRIHPLWKDDTP